MFARNPLAPAALAVFSISAASTAAALPAEAAGGDAPSVSAPAGDAGADAGPAPVAPAAPGVRLNVAIAGALPEAAAWMDAGDFDGDGRGDLAMVTGTGDVYVALNAGDLASWSWALVGSVPLGLLNEVYSGMKVADLDDDGLSDLLIVGDLPVPGTCAATVLTSLGDGNFATGITLTVVPPTPDDVVFGCTDTEIGDHDGDGALDVVVGYAYQPIDWLNGLLGAVNVFLGVGSGELDAPAQYLLAAAPEPFVSFEMTSGDFDADGRADLGFGSAVRYLSGPVAWRVETLRGDGLGGFSPGTLREFDCTWCELELASAADFDGDGRDDLLLAPTNPESYPSDYPALLFASQVDGTFAAPESIAIHTGTVALEARDITSDGLADVLLLGDADHVMLLEGQGDGGFAVPRRFVTGQGIASSTLADLDGDGASELVLLSRVVSDTQPLFEIARGASSGGFELPLVSAVPSGYSDFLAEPADFDGDGNVDVLAIGYDRLELMLGTGDGRFVPGATTPSESSAWSMPVYDLNGDGRLDLVQAAGDGFAVALGLSDGTFSPTPSSSGRIIAHAALGDLDGDGDADLVATEYGRDTVDVYLGDGAQGFARAASLPLGVYDSGLVLADLSSDGVLDLVVGAARLREGPAGEPLGPLVSAVWLGDGRGGFTSGAAIDVSGLQLRVADIDHDGSLDVLSTNAIAFGDGAGNFGSPDPLPSAGAYQLQLADLDADGFSDLLFNRGELLVARGGPGGRFQPGERLGGTAGWLSFAVAQLAGDPGLDVVALHAFTREDQPKTELVVAENVTAPACARR
jgi:VCBS repeat protein